MPMFDVAADLYAAANLYDLLNSKSILERYVWSSVLQSEISSLFCKIGLKRAISPLWEVLVAS